MLIIVKKIVALFIADYDIFLISLEIKKYRRKKRVI
jgi:hypothetical protein